MLFDLRGKRKRVVQVVYAFLAVVFLISFVGFGIGSDAAGGIFDALGIGGGSGSGPSNPQYEEQIERAEDRLQQNPEDERALLTLARVHFLAGQSELEQDEETGEPVLTDEARTQFEAAVDGWERYLEAKPKKVDDGVGLQVLQAYDLLSRSEVQPETLQARLEGAEETAAVVAEEQPSQNTFGTLAQYAYLSGDSAEGDEAAKLALAEAEPAQRKSLQRFLEQFEQQGRQLQKLIKQQAAGKEQLTTPLEGPGGGGLGGTQPAP